MSYKSTSRFTASSFIAKQQDTLAARRELLSLLRLPEGSEKSFEIVGKRIDLVGEYEEIANVADLQLVKYVELSESNESVTFDIKHKTRGTVIANMPSGSFVFRKSVPFRHEALNVDCLTPNSNGEVVFNSFETYGSSLEPLASNISFRPYVEGTVYEIGCFGGKIIEMTTRNLLPRGVASHEKGWIHQPAAWGREVFSESFDRIVKIADPNMMLPGVLFPKGCLISPFTYRFIICTRERVRAYNHYVPEEGFLVFLDAVENWSYETSKLTPQETGTRHVKPYTPRMVHSMEDVVKGPCIVSPDVTMTLEEASNYLRGNKDQKDARFAGGGALVANFSVEEFSGDVTDYVIHIKSTGYLHRALITGTDEGDSYKQFMSLLKYTDYSLEIPSNIKLLEKYFPCLVLPNTSGILNASKHEAYNVVELIKSNLALPVVSMKLPSLGHVKQNKVMTVLWHTVLCTNPLKRADIWNLGRRMDSDLNLTVAWLVGFNKSTPIKELDITDVQLRNIKNSIIKFRSDMISKSIKYREASKITSQDAYKQYMISQGEKATRIFTLCNHSRNQDRQASNSKSVRPFSKRESSKRDSLRSEPSKEAKIEELGDSLYYDQIADEIDMTIPEDVDGESTEEEEEDLPEVNTDDEEDASTVEMDWRKALEGDWAAEA